MSGAVDRVITELTNGGFAPRQSGSSWSARCPGHEDAHASLSVSEGQDGRALLKCHAGCDLETILDALGLKAAELFEAQRDARVRQARAGQEPAARIVAMYPYRSESGTLLYEVVRRDPKDFAQRRPGPDGKWIWNLKGVRRVPYRLPELLASPPEVRVFVVEGERDVDALRALGLVATTNSGGAGKWTSELSGHFRDRHVVVLPDNDDPGRAHAEAVARALAGVASSVKVLPLQNLPQKGDVSDWLEARRGQGVVGDQAREELERLVAEAPAWAEVTSAATDGSARGRQADADGAGSKPRSEHPHPAGGGSWPAPPAKEAFAGLAGEWVRLLNPHTEADPSALLLQFLAAFGNALNRGPYTQVESDRHYTNLFVTLVGKTSKARKGTSWGHVRRLFEQVDEGWVNACVWGGLSSGEGLIWAVRDEIWKEQPVREKGRVTGYESVKQDAGVTDKRLLVLETELASALRVMAREGNTLSAVIRQAWDTGNLRSLTKNSPACATDAHISVLAHITADEVKKELTEIDMANGFANRFLWAAVRRSKLLPEGGNLDDAALETFARKLEKVLGAARQVRRVERDEDARAFWAERYLELSEGQAGLLGAITSRAEAQVTRLSLVYALLAGHSVITVKDLEAAFALWEFCERSARHIFGAPATESEEEQRRRQLVQVIAGRPGRTVTVHWLANSSLRVYRQNRELAERDLMALRAQGLGELRDPPSGPATGRSFVLSGEALDADAPENRPEHEDPPPLHVPNLGETNSSAPEAVDIAGDSARPELNQVEEDEDVPVPAALERDEDEIRAFLVGEGGGS